MSDRNLSIVPDGDGGRPPAVAADLLGRHLRRLRERAGLLQKDVVAAKAIGSESMLSKYETGKVPVQERHVRRLVQLYALYTNQAAIGGFGGFYWSSTEFGVGPAYNSWSHLFTSASQGTSSKLNSYRVRCVRAFTP